MLKKFENENDLTLQIYLNQANQKKFNDFLGIKRWISTKIDLPREKLSADFKKNENFWFPILDKNLPETCKALIITIQAWEILEFRVSQNDTKPLPRII